MSVRLELDKLVRAVDRLPPGTGIVAVTAWPHACTLQLRHLDEWKAICGDQPPNNIDEEGTHFYDRVIDGVEFNCHVTQEQMAARAIGAMQADPHSAEAVQSASACLGEGDASWEGE